MNKVWQILLMAALLSALVWGEAIYPALNQEPENTVAGVRPYELDWAGRDLPAHPQLVDFEDLTNWRVRCFDGAEATLFRSRQKLLFGDYTARVEYTGETYASRFIIEPLEPIVIPNEFTGVNLWIHGNTWTFDRNQRNALVGVNVLVRDAVNRDFTIPMDGNWADYWFLSHRTCVSPDGSTVMYTALDGKGGRIEFPAAFAGIEVTGAYNQQTEWLHFDALQFYVMEYPPLEFASVPEVLAWPTTEDTILPTLKTPVSVARQFYESHCEWRITGDETIIFRYTPETGTLDDIRAQAGGQTFFPCYGGGIQFQMQDSFVRANSDDASARLVAFDATGGGCRATWEISWRNSSARYVYGFATKGKSLIIDVTTEDGDAVRLDIGGAKGLHEPKTVNFPYLTYGDDWPRTIVSQSLEGPVFLWAACDYYNSHASELFGSSGVGGAAVVPYTGGALYKPTTAGIRNPMHERIFVNISCDVQETLPNIPNPDSENAHQAREYLWQNIGHVHQRERLSQYKAYGIDKFIVCHHEVGWREGGESFTLRDRPADSIGAEALAAYGAFVRGLGYYFGTYTNYVDYAPVNANWNEDHVNLNPDGAWQRAWPRCYALKPLRAAEFEAKYAPRIRDLYGVNAQYCDVHTAYTPWGRTDYDARTPGAGMFRTQFDAYARLLENESRVYGGPVFSEGNYHWFYAGIVDGNYATIMPYGEGWKAAPLVDFDLLKMHTKMTDFGMGFGEMFYGYQGEWQHNPHRLNPWFDRFTASTIAFGHIGFLTYEWGFEATLKGYYQLQALQQRYALVPVRDIRYFDGNALLDTSAALISDAYKMRHIFVEYENGLRVWVNLNFSEDWEVTLDETTYRLPPTGFLAHKPNDILAYAAIVNGHRHELVQCDDYLYLDSRDAFVRADAIASNASVAVKREGDGLWWIIPITSAEEVSICRAWLGVDNGTVFEASAVNEAGDIVMDAEVRHGGQWITVVPVNDSEVIKYRLRKRDTGVALPRVVEAPERLLPNAAFKVIVAVDAAVVSPDDSVKIKLFTDDASILLTEAHWDIDGGEAVATLHAQFPDDVETGTRHWLQCVSLKAGPLLWLDVFAVPPMTVSFLSDEAVSRRAVPLPFEIALTNNMLEAVTAKTSLSVGDYTPRTQAVELSPTQSTTLRWEIEQPEANMTQRVFLRTVWPGGHLEEERFLRTESTEYVIADLTELTYTGGQCLRGEAERPYDHPGTKALIASCRETLGEITLDGLHTHPPWGDNTGYVFTVWPLELPEESAQLDFALGFRSGSTTDDGCVFKVNVLSGGDETTLFSEQYQRVDAWAKHSVDLSDYAGQSVEIKLITDVGPADNSHSDWALWGAPRVVAKAPMTKQHLLTEQPPDSYQPSPRMCPGLGEKDLRNVAAAHIVMETAGVDGGQYASYVYFNGVRLGEVPVSESDTSWKSGKLPLTTGAIETIGASNTVVIRNPNKDFMKVRRIWLHLELEDGRTCCSHIALGPWCSAVGWPHEEGMSVHIGHDLHPIRLDMPLWQE